METKDVKSAKHQLVNGKTMMEILGVSPPTFIKYRKKYNLPYIMFGGQFRYDPEKVLAALEINGK